MKKIVYVLVLVLVFSCGETKQEVKDSKEEIVIEGKAIVSDAEYFGKGKQIATESFGAMSSKLKAAMKSGGVEKAVNFCKANAGSIIDSLSKHHKVDIKRTSLKLRNAENKPTTEEEEILNIYKDGFDAKANVRPIIKRSDNEVSFYAPIKLQGACISCHGEIGKQITDSDYSLIKKLYPEDSATGYKVDDFRGIWHITFKK